MFPLSTSQSGRVFHHRILMSCDSIWISDHLLAAAFARYYAVSRVALRHASSTPGPLENRRRMGKRQMGELSCIQPSPGPPLWEFTSTVDLSQWTWQPPSHQTSSSLHNPISLTGRSPLPSAEKPPLPPVEIPPLPSAELSSLPSAETSPLLPTEAPPLPSPESPPGPEDRFLDWYWRSLAPKPKAQDPVNIHNPTIPAVELGTTVIVPRVVPKHKWQTEIPWNEKTGPREVADHALNILQWDVHSDPTFRVIPGFNRFCEYLIQNLAAGWFSDDSICLISRYIRASLPKAVGFLGEIHHQRRVDDVKLVLSEAMMDGLTARINNGHATFDERSWNELLMGIAEIERNGLRMFGEVMARIPKVHLYSVTSGILANISTHLTHAGNTTNGQQSLLRQANKMAGILHQFEPVGNADIFASVTEELFCRVGWQSNYGQSRLSWLLVLLRIPGVDLDYFFRACATLDTYTLPLTRFDICQLYLALCRRNIGSSAGRSLQEHVKVSFPNSPYAYVKLCIRFWKAGQDEYLRGICHFLERLGRTQDVFLLVKGFLRRIQNEATPLANLAIGLKQPHLAIRCYILFAESARQPGRPFWTSGFATKALRELLQPRSKSRKFFDAIGAFPKSRRKVQRFRRIGRPALTRQQVQKIANLAHVLVTSPYLSNRTSFTLVTWCVHYFRYHNAHVPPLVLRGLVYNVTRDLAAGKAGRTRRIRWVLANVYKYGGPELASRLQLSLQRWRRKNFEAFRLRGYVDPPLQSAQGHFAQSASWV